MKKMILSLTLLALTLLLANCGAKPDNIEGRSSRWFADFNKCREVLALLEGGVPRSARKNGTDTEIAR